MRPLQPFQQPPLSEVPAAPRLPHHWGLMSEARIRLDVAPFGPHEVQLASCGEGEPLLLLHGLMWRGFSWRYAVGPLAKRFRLFVPDLPGAGGSDAPKVAYSPTNLGAWLAELVDHLGIRGCRCIGNSMGGYLAMQAALRDPTLFGRLVNLHGPGIPEAKHYALHAAMRTPGAGAALDWLVGRDPVRWCHRNVHYYDESLKSLEELELVAEPLRHPDGRQAFGRYLRDAMSVTTMRRFHQELDERRATDQAFPIPLCHVYAPRDPMVAPWVGDRLAALTPGSEHHRLPHGSHFAHVDALEPFLSATEAFLA